MKRKALILAVALVAAGSLALLAQYATKVHFGPNGDTLVVESGGTAQVASGGTLQVDSGATFTISGSSFAPSSYVPITTAGASTITSTGATTEAVVLTMTAGEESAGWTITTDATGGTTGSLGINGAALTYAANGSTVLTYSNSTFSFTNGVQAVGTATPPVACSAGTAGTIYYDSDVNELCVCNASGYVQIDDMTTGCS